jgi:hypothetical protein
MSTTITTTTVTRGDLLRHPYIATAISVAREQGVSLLPEEVLQDLLHEHQSLPALKIALDAVYNGPPEYAIGIQVSIFAYKIPGIDYLPAWGPI